MLKSLGFSLYLSTFAAQCSALGGWTESDTPVFLSLHISEEFDSTYCRRAEEACHWLADQGFRVIADVSVKTLDQFGETDIVALSKRLRLWALRIDYGFDRTTMESIAAQMPIVVNASTITAEDAALIAGRGREVFAMHNFYPRPETGLDEDYLARTTEQLQAAGLKVFAFIPGDTALRGPVFEGLPTLEAHRSVLPSAAFVDLAVRFGMDEIFLGDPGLSEKEAARIALYCRENIISVPALLDDAFQTLYDRTVTCRMDSPKWLIRITESREYSCKGETVPPANCIQRCTGSITIDNETYGRYTGEIQITRSDMKQDSRVNVIGQVPENAWLLLHRIRGGQKFRLVRP
ncbi:MAG: MupG family TIM beta-alpha barrel fold protein [Faecousia sp.]